MKRYDIYLGLKNKDKSSDSSIGKIKNAFASYFSEYETGFSITEQIGGYVCEDKSYVIEPSLKISLIGDYEDSLINSFTEYIKKYFSQESLLISIKELEIEYK